MCSKAYPVLAAILIGSAIGRAGEASKCAAAPVFEQASALLSKKQFDEAYKVLGTLNACRNLTPLEKFQLGWLYGRARHFDAALQQFQAVPVNTPDLVTHQYAVALSEFELARYDQAIAVLTNLQSQRHLDDKCANLLGVSYSKLNQYPKADAIFEQVIRDYPDDPAGYFNRITLYADTGNLDQAAVLASETTERFPGSFQAFVVLGAANTMIGRLEAAHTAFTTAVELAPHQPDPRFFQALASYKQDKLDAAIAELDSAEKAGIQDSDLHYLKAECLVRRDASHTAAILSELNTAIQLDGTSVSARVLRGKIELSEHEREKALRDLELAHKVDPASRSAAYNLARTYQALGRKQEARALFQKVSEKAINPLQELSDHRLSSTLKGGSAP
jgi:tetratricopeptide (TPR) repeat protein